MTVPIVTETTRPPEPVVPDPFLEDGPRPVAPPLPETRRRRIVD